MSLKPSPIPPVPGVTACVAQAAFPHGNVVMQLRDALGTIYTDKVFTDLFPTHGQAADAVRDRLAWKYALSLELTDPGFDHTVLSEFRSPLVEGNAERRLLDLLLDWCREGGWLKAHGRQRTDSTHVLAKIRALSRTLCVAQTMVRDQPDETDNSGFEYLALFGIRWHGSRWQVTAQPPRGYVAYLAANPPCDGVESNLAQDSTYANAPDLPPLSHLALHFRP